MGKGQTVGVRVEEAEDERLVRVMDGHMARACRKRAHRRERLFSLAIQGADGRFVSWARAAFDAIRTRVHNL